MTMEQAMQVTFPDPNFDNNPLGETMHLPANGLLLQDESNVM